MQLCTYRVFSTALVGVASAPSDYECGYLPREITLKRGERQTLIYWNDQGYEQPSLNEDNGALETAKNPKEDETTPTIMSANSSVNCSWNIKVFWME